MKRCIMLLLLCLLLAGCGEAPEGPAEEDLAAEEPAEEAIPFRDGQLYAAAYLGYGEMEGFAFYQETYLAGAVPPTHHVSPGEYYLIIPRYPDTALELYRNDLETGEKILVYEDGACGPFLLHCNTSDIFADAAIRLTYQGKTAEFSPCISLENGSPLLGELGLDITK